MQLNLYHVSSIDELAWPEEIGELSLSSPAVLFFTDFQHVKPLVIESSLSAAETLLLMHKTHVRLKFVVDSHNRLIGIVNSDSLSEEKLVLKVSEGYLREDIPVTDFMIPKSALHALEYSEVTRASIGNVINALKDNGEQHCLVIDHETHKIRGIFSASDISRKLHLPINIQHKSSFFHIFTEIGAENKF